VVVRRPGNADRKISLDETSLGPLVEIISRGAVAAGVNDIMDEVAFENKLFAGETVDAFIAR
jgi:hypothetical protein